ncbi:hypothetical protein Ancab_006943 [Ancistrocladus abbreviatus]
MASLHISPTPNPDIHNHKPIKFPTSIKPNSVTHIRNHQQQHQKNLQNPCKSYFIVSSPSKDAQLQEALNLFTHMEFNDFQIGPEFYVELLQKCVYERALFLGQQIHGLILKKGDIYARNECIETKLVIFYAKCDALEDVNRLFCRLCRKNEFSWAAFIGLNSRVGLNEGALLGYCEMLENGISPDNFVVPNALKACGAAQCVSFGRGVHGYVLKAGFEGCIYVASSLVDMYGKCGVLEDARRVFDTISERNVVAWNSMIVGYFQNGMNEEAIGIFYKMRVEGVEPTRVTVSSFLSASANLGALEEGKQGHAIAVLSGLELDNILGSSLINFYSKVGLIQDAELIFARMVDKDVVTWNLLISSYVQHGLVENAVNMCHVMRMEKLRFDCVTLASLMSASADRSDIKLGKEGHGYCIRNNLDLDVVVTTSTVDMYAKCQKVDYARRVFNSALERDLVLWNAIMAIYAELGLSGEALKLFYQMQLEGLQPNLISWNSVILALFRNAQVNEGKNMFSQMQFLGVQPNIVTWTTLVTGLAQNGFSLEAIKVFQQMQEAGIQPNTLSLTSVLSACTDATSLQVGEAVYGYITRRGVYLSTEVQTSLVDMYAKCGRIDQAKKVFEMTSNKELALYNAMICGYAHHGQPLEALGLYKNMQLEFVAPDDITCTILLSACSHGGLVSEGLELFVEMISKYNFKPSMEHYGCLVSLLSRCGNLDEAIRLTFSLPLEPDAQILGSLLSACKEHHLIELGEHIARHLFNLEPDNSGNYVALSNAYAAAGRWDDASELRNFMKRQCLEKSPGCSWVQIGSESHVFVAGDKSHPQTLEIYAVIALLGKEMRSNNNVHFNSEIYCS